MKPHSITSVSLAEPILVEGKYDDYIFALSTDEDFWCFALLFASAECLPQDMIQMACDDPDRTQEDESPFPRLWKEEYYHGDVFLRIGDRREITNPETGKYSEERILGCIDRLIREFDRQTLSSN